MIKLSFLLAAIPHDRSHWIAGAVVLLVAVTLVGLLGFLCCRKKEQIPRYFIITRAYQMVCIAIICRVLYNALFSLVGNGDTLTIL